MQTYGGKFHRKGEETRDRLLREKIKTIKWITMVCSAFLWTTSVGYTYYKNYEAVSWNQDVIAKTKDVWKSLDKLEADVMSSVLFLKGCRKDMIFQETENGFELQTVDARSQSMEVLRNVPAYSEQALAVYMGSGIRPGDELVYCNAEQEKKVKLQVIRSNPKYSFNYVIFDQNISFEGDLPANLIKFKPISYRWEVQGDGSEKLFRASDGQEIELLSRIKSHKISYALKDAGVSYFRVDLALTSQFPDGSPMEIRRNIPLKSFQRLPPELENQVP